MADVNVLGSLEAKFESTNRIYDVGGCSPTLSTMQGGNQEPKILEAKQLGFMDNGTCKHQSQVLTWLLISYWQLWCLFHVGGLQNQFQSLLLHL